MWKKHRSYATTLMARGKEIINHYDFSREQNLKKLKISQGGRIATIHALDSEFLEELEDEKEIKLISPFTMVLQILIMIITVY